MKQGIVIRTVLIASIVCNSILNKIKHVKQEDTFTRHVKQLETLH
jgi:hypothetical protein